MEQFKAKYRQHLDRLLSQVDGTNPEAVSAAFDRLRDAHDQMVSKHPRLVESGREQNLRTAMEAVIAEYARSLAGNDLSYSSSQADKIVSAYPTSRLSNPIAWLGLGAATALVAFTVLAYLSIFHVSYGAAAARAIQFEEEHQRSLEQFQEVVAFLQYLEEEIIRLQSDDPRRLVEKVGKRLIHISHLDEDLDSQRPKGLPLGSAFVVRADEEAYKVLFTWPLCRTAAIERPELVDPRRVNDGLNCSHFGFWNKAGEGF